MFTEFDMHTAACIYIQCRTNVCLRGKCRFLNKCNCVQRNSLSADEYAHVALEENAVARRHFSYFGAMSPYPFRREPLSRPLFAAVTFL